MAASTLCTWCWLLYVLLVLVGECCNVMYNIAAVHMMAQPRFAGLQPAGETWGVLHFLRTGA
jgi:hypothetical protein